MIFNKKCKDQYLTKGYIVDIQSFCTTQTYTVANKKIINPFESKPLVDKFSFLKNISCTLNGRTFFQSSTNETSTLVIGLDPVTYLSYDDKIKKKTFQYNCTIYLHCYFYHGRALFMYFMLLDALQCIYDSPCEPFCAISRTLSTGAVSHHAMNGEAESSPAHSVHSTVSVDRGMEREEREAAHHQMGRPDHSMTRPDHSMSRNMPPQHQQQQEPQQRQLPPQPSGPAPSRPTPDRYVSIYIYYIIGNPNLKHLSTSTIQTNTGQVQVRFWFTCGCGAIEVYRMSLYFLEFTGLRLL